MQLFNRDRVEQQVHSNLKEYQVPYQYVEKRLGAQPTFVGQTESLRQRIHHTAPINIVVLS